MPTVSRQRRTKKATRGKTTRRGTGSRKRQIKEDPTDRIIDLEDKPFNGYKICIFGFSGTGKTRLAGTFNEEGPLLHMICSSNGLEEATSLKGMEDIKIVEVQAGEEVPIFVDYAVQHGFKTVVLDHLGGYCDVVLAEVLGLDKLPEQRTWKTAKRDDFMDLSQRVKSYLRTGMDANINFIIIAQERAFTKGMEDEDVIVPFITVASTPTIAKWIEPSVNYMCHTFKRFKKKKVGKGRRARWVDTNEIEYCLKVGADPYYITKFRVPVGTELPDVIVDPTCEQLKEYF